MGIDWSNPKRKNKFRPDIIRSKIGNFNLLSERHATMKIKKKSVLSWGKCCENASTYLNTANRQLKQNRENDVWYYTALYNIADMKKIFHRKIKYVWVQAEYVQLLKLNYFKQDADIDILFSVKCHFEQSRINSLARKSKRRVERNISNWTDSIKRAKFCVNYFKNTKSHTSSDFNDWDLSARYSVRQFVNDHYPWKCRIHEIISHLNKFEVKQ
jgi:hypothetical protein